jgi:hypothetical protein
LPGTLYLPNSVSPDEGNEEERSFFAKGTSIKNYKLEIFSPFGELLWFCEEGNFEMDCQSADGPAPTYKVKPCHKVHTCGKLLEVSKTELN